MRLLVLTLILLISGCHLDDRPVALRRAMDQVRSVLANPRLLQMARQKKAPLGLEERLVECLFSPEGQKLWPKPLDAEHDFRSQDASRLPGRIAYLRRPELPWCVVVRAEPERHRINLSGYGQTLDSPLLTESISLQP